MIPVKTDHDLLGQFERHPALPQVRAWLDAEARLPILRREFAAARLEQMRLIEQAAALDRRALQLEARGDDAAAGRLAATAAAYEVTKQEVRVAGMQQELDAVAGELGELRLQGERACEPLLELGRQLHGRAVTRMAKALRELGEANAEEKAIALAMHGALRGRASARIRRLFVDAVGTADDPNSLLTMWLKEAREYGYDV